MALKKQNQIQAAFSMASMTDVIFLLLVFFMVTSTFVFPTAMEINLPEGSVQTPLKPTTTVYIDADGNITVGRADTEAVSADIDNLCDYLILALQQDTTQTAVAVYADTQVNYGRVVEVLNAGASNGVKMVLATRPASDGPADLSATPGNDPAAAQPDPEL